jgi:hypothetical protein
MRPWLLPAVIALLLPPPLLLAMQVQMTEDLTKEEVAQRARWLKNKTLRCEVCHKMVDEVYVTAERARNGKKMEEIHIVEAVEDICKFEGAGGAWIRSVKVVENEPDDFDIEPIENVIFRSNCDVSCQSIYRLCNKIMENDIDIDAFTGHMLSGGSKFAADQLVCAKTCTKKSKTKKSKPKSSQASEL